MINKLNILHVFGLCSIAGYLVSAWNLGWITGLLFFGFLVIHLALIIALLCMREGRKRFGPGVFVLWAIFFMLFAFGAELQRQFFYLRQNDLEALIQKVQELPSSERETQKLGRVSILGAEFPYLVLYNILLESPEFADVSAEDAIDGIEVHYPSSPPTYRAAYLWVKDRTNIPDRFKKRWRKFIPLNKNWVRVGGQPRREPTPQSVP